ncbi:MAG: hypothetical protein GF387_00745 [Candidatus Portnoybacteria bacterium]|nr:hypothetical protein [Candidatus Portnoybacteria bacterium]
MNSYVTYEKELLAQAGSFFTDLFNDVVDFFSSYKWQEIVFDLRSVFISASIVLLALIIAVFIKSTIASRKEKKIKEKKKDKGLNNKWEKIEKELKTETEENYKMAILDADNLYNEVLKNIGRDAEKNLEEIEDLKMAKKIKSNILEDRSLVVSKKDATTAVGAYRRALKDLGVL